MRVVNCQQGVCGCPFVQSVAMCKDTFSRRFKFLIVFDRKQNNFTQTLNILIRWDELNTSQSATNLLVFLF